MLGLCCFQDSPLAAASGGYSLVAVCGLLMAVASLVAVERAVSIVVAHGLGCSAARGTSPSQGSNACPLHWQVDSLPLSLQGNPELTVL